MIRFTVNGREVEVDAPDDEPLVWVLRDNLGLTGTRFGCGGGYCGSCSILLDGSSVQSCLLPVSAVAGRDVRTIEAPVAAGSVLGHVRDAFVEHQVPQCGWCMTGWQMVLTSTLEADPSIDDDALIDRLDANLCRCGTYTRLRSAALDAAQRVRSSGATEDGA